MNVLYEHMYPDEFLKAVEKCPVFFVPTGLMEWHGDHLPLGQDTMKAHGICVRAAEKLGGGIVLPGNYIGRPGFSSYTGTLTFSEGLVHSLFHELFQELRKVGAKIIYVLTGHYGPCQVDCLKRAAFVFGQEYPDVKVFAKPEYEGALVEGMVPADHAGTWETSMFWSFHPELVDMDRFREKPLQQKIYSDTPHDFYHESGEWTWGSDVKSTSSPQLGAKAVDIITDVMVGEIRSALDIYMRRKINMAEE